MIKFSSKTFVLISHNSYVEVMKNVQKLEKKLYSYSIFTSESRIKWIMQAFCIFFQTQTGENFVR